MNYPIQEIEGIGPAYGEKLGLLGIKTTGDFLTQCAHAKGRKSVAEKTGMSESLILTWANRADLMRISGVGPQYAELLEAAGVDTVKDLKMRVPENLAARMAEVNGQKRLSGTSPAASVVRGWVEAAKTLPPTISH